MTGTRQKGFVALLLLGLAVQGVVLTVSLRAGHALDPSSSPGIWLPALAILPLAFALRSVCRARRAAFVLLLIAEVLILVSGPAAVTLWRLDPEGWAADRQADLQPQIRSVQEAVPRLPVLADSLLSEGAAVSESLEAMVGAWRRDLERTGRFPLALALWRHGERVDWTDALEPFPRAGLPAPGERPAVDAGRAGWYWRGSVVHPVGLLEWQIRLARPPESEAAGVSRQQVRGQVLHAVEPSGGRWYGSPEHGSRYTTDIALEFAPADMELPLLRLTATVPPLRVAHQQAGVRLALIRLLLWGLALAAAGGWLGGRLWLVVALWAARSAWATAGLFERAQLLLARSHLESHPTAPSSLLDPAYFGTDWGRGLYATTLDAVLTGALVALTAWIVGRAVRGAGPPGDPDAPARDRVAGAARYRPLLFVLLAVGLFVVQDRLVHEVVANANPRLIGPRITLRFLTFWGLHLALLLSGMAVAGLLVGLASRLRRDGARGATLLVLFAAVAFSLLAGPWLPPASRVFLPLLLLSLWWGTGLLPAGDTTVRRLVWLLPLLVAVFWNYLALGHAYEESTRDWLLRKSADIVESQDDWVRFLMEDLLSEMAAADAERAPSPGAHDPGAAELWQNWSAFALWEEVGLDELGLPCRVEMLDESGGTTSLFAAGFFRNYGYEIADRGEWEMGRPVTPRPDRSLNTYLQTERRRFTDGEEHILRGEVERLAGNGWLSLELPVQSFRTRTLLAQLTGQRPGGDAEGYVPRLEVDRPLLMLRSDGRDWRGTGGADLPDGESAGVVADLRAGDLDWGLVSAGGRRHLCLWRDALDVPDDRDAAAPDSGGGFLLGVRIPSLSDRLLDFSRLILLDLLLLLAISVCALAAMSAAKRRRPFLLGFQERFLVVSLVLGLLPLLLAGTFIDRLSREWLAESSRADTRAGVEAAGEQLQGLLAEQARALAGSDYIADLLASRLAGQRPLGPFSSRQAMIFTADGDLLLDETLSDLDAAEAALLLEQARTSSLVLMRDETGVYLGTLIPVDLSGVAAEFAEAEFPGGVHGPVARRRHGFFFYRQAITTDLMVGLGEVVQGETVFYLGGESILASHPEHIFTGHTPLLLPSASLPNLRNAPGGILLQPAPGSPHAWTGMMSLPTLLNSPGDQRLRAARVPGVLAVTFSARERDVTGQRERTVLFLAGLATLIFLTATLLALVLTWKIFDPVRVLVDATRRLAAGDFAAPLPDSGSDEIGTLSATFGAMRDELNETQEALAERERFLARLLERVPVGVAVFDGDRRVVTVNPAAREMIDVYFAGAAGGADDRARLLLDGFTRQVAGGEGEAELVAPGGRRTLRGRLAPLRLPDGRTDRMLVFEDVTEFLDNKRLALNAQLARQVAHEVKNPLTPIQLSVQFLRQAFRDGADGLDEIVESTVRQVLEQVELLRSIATEFSLLGRPEDLACEPVDFPALVAEVIDRYRVGAGDEAASRLSIDAPDRDVPPVMADAESLGKVIANLMENSLQAAGGMAALELGIDWRVEPDTVALLWSDNGPGLADEVADRLFDLYFSTKTQGTGLGLPICRNLLSRMDGSITLRNRETGTGAVAEVILPRADT